MNESDKVYADKLTHVVDFVFDEKVAAVFPDMLRRSVPGYETIISLLGVIAERYAQSDSTIYDLGCSLGAAMLSIQSRITDPSIQFVGVDNSAPMLQQCRNHLDRAILPETQDGRFRLLHCDVRDVDIQNASMVVLNFTLQFVAATERLALLRQIYAGMKDNGVIVLSEKICFADALKDDLQQSLHDQFKFANGYSDLEIAQKRAALEKVMRLDSADTHIKRLRQAGFSRITQWFQTFNFCSFIAVKCLPKR